MSENEPKDKRTENENGKIDGERFSYDVLYFLLRNKIHADEH